ncbi:unnamed protein product [Closterium sp. NIES-53]
MTLLPTSIPQRIVLPEPLVSSLPHVPDPEYDLARAASPTVTGLLATDVTESDFDSAAAFALVTELVDFAARGRLDYVASLVTESESVCPPSVGGEPALSSDVLEDKRVKRLPGSPPAFKARYVARGFSQRQGVDFFQTFSPTPKMTTLWVLLHVAAHRDYELHSLDFSTNLLQGSLHEEIWLRRPPGFTGTTFAALGFGPSSANLSLFLRTDTTLPPFYVLVARYTITLTQSHMVHLVLQRFGFQFSSPQPTPLSASHSLSAPPSNESVEPSGLYPELVGCLMYLMTCTRPDLTYPLSLLARYVAPGRHRKVHWDAAKRVMRYLCSTSGMGLVLGGQGSVVLIGLSDASWADDQATQRSSEGYTLSLGSGSISWRSTRSSSVLCSNCEAEIYAGAMAA